MVDDEDEPPEWELGSTQRRRSSRLYKLKARPSSFDKDLVTPEVVEVTSKEDLTCPVTACQEQFVRSVHLKRHLTSTHKIQNPLDISEAEINQIHANDEIKKSVEEDKVPPLKIKLNQNESAIAEETMEKGGLEETEQRDESSAVIAEMSEAEERAETTESVLVMTDAEITS